jgi:survival-of-motor-neuron-related-splicing factor 30
LQALWIGDGQWYEAAVQEVLDYGYKLKFTKYGNEAEVPFEYIRASGAAKAAEVDAAVAGQKRPAAGEGEAKEGAGAFVIPMHLRVLPTDSEEERLRKRKRVKHLKAAAKKKDKGEDDAEQGKNWQDYLNKVSGCYTLFSRPRQHTHDALRTRQCSS